MFCVKLHGVYFLFETVTFILYKIETKLSLFEIHYLNLKLSAIDI